MGGIVMKTTDMDFEDIQGLLRYGYGKMGRARFELLRIKDLTSAQSWLEEAAITNAVETSPPPSTALQVAFTVAGLHALGVPHGVIKGFSHEFRGGMSDPNRARQLGDIGANAPELWRWGKPGNEPHLVVMIYASKERFDAYAKSVKGMHWDNAFERVANSPLETTELDRYEPFGFADGISQPEIDWRGEKQIRGPEFAYSNITAAGELVLGHPNEYGKITDRPLLEDSPETAHLPPAPEAPDLRDLGRNGTYLVIRQLEQDVRGFWSFLHEKSGGDSTAAEALGAAMVGRTREGEPLASAPEAPIPGIAPDDKLNQFDFSADPAGSRCPFGSHLRRANPRNADFPVRPANLFKKVAIMLGFGPRGFRDDLESSVRFHRIVRRGREFGVGIIPEDALSPAPPDEKPRGIHFICLNANISRQFEFLQNAWMAGTKFSGLTGESDPLTGTREPIPGCPVTSGFTRPREDAPPERIKGLPRFVTVRGGAYFFMPGLRALKYIASAGKK
jgi:deferrochelatase/peroxidase EfeB